MRRIEISLVSGGFDSKQKGAKSWQRQQHSRLLLQVIYFDFRMKKLFILYATTRISL